MDSAAGIELDRSFHQMGTVNVKVCESDFVSLKKKSKNLVSFRSRELSLVSRLVSWDKCLVTPLSLSIFTFHCGQGAGRGGAEGAAAPPVFFCGQL